MAINSNNFFHNMLVLAGSMSPGQDPQDVSDRLDSHFMPVGTPDPKAAFNLTPQGKAQKAQVVNAKARQDLGIQDLQPGGNPGPQAAPAAPQPQAAPPPTQISGQAAPVGQLPPQQTTAAPTPAQTSAPQVDPKIAGLLQGLGISPNSPDGVQKAQQINPTDPNETQDNNEPGDTVSQDVPQVTIGKDGIKYLTTPSGVKVPLS